ncbi:MAG: pilus assembly protein PilM, partial [Glaciimonas sp.]|nr:pilus assembly protein PilM [Glaciimonas sp.]
PAQHSPEDIEVLLAATRKEKVEDCVAVAEAAGLKPMVMDIESYAARGAISRLIAQLPKAGKGKIIGLFQIGAQITHISVLLDGQLIYEREQAFGGHQLTQDIVRAYGFSYEEADAKKRTGDLPDTYQQELLNPFLENAALELTRAIQFFFTSTPYTRIDQIFLAGGCAIIPGMVEAVAGRAKVSTSVISPFTGMKLAPNVREKQLRIDAPSYLVACGLAMRRFG